MSYSATHSTSKSPLSTDTTSNNSTGNVNNDNCSHHDTTLRKAPHHLLRKVSSLLKAEGIEANLSNKA